MLFAHLKRILRAPTDCACAGRAEPKTSSYWRPRPKPEKLAKLIPLPKPILAT